MQHGSGVLTIVALAFVLACNGLAGFPSKSLVPIDQPNHAALSAEQLQVYSDFLEQFSNLNFQFLAEHTFYFERARVKESAPCLKGLQFSNEPLPVGTRHSLNPSVLRGRSIPIVSEQEESAILRKRDANSASSGDGSTTPHSPLAKDLGVLALSEITFDKSHNYALVRYVLLCGSHCNSGSVLVLERVGSKWKSVRPACNVAINEENPRR
jgi:hypothetical protein